MKRFFFYLLISSPLWAPLLHHLIYESKFKEYQLRAFHKDTKLIVLVLGAGINEEGPSAILEDRLLTALDLQKNYPQAKLFLSGAAHEVPVMKAYLEKHGAQNLVLDPQGHRTQASILNLKQQMKDYEFSYIVSQDFHLARASLLARTLDIPHLIAKADRREYLYIKRYRLREVFAQIYSWKDVISHSSE